MHPYPHLIEGASLPSLREQAAREPVVLDLPCCIKDPKKAAPEFLVWPLIKFYSLVAQTVKNPPAMQGPGFDPWVGMIH